MDSSPQEEMPLPESLHAGVSFPVNITQPGHAKYVAGAPEGMGPVKLCTLHFLDDGRGEPNAPYCCQNDEDQWMASFTVDRLSPRPGRDVPLL